LGVGEVLILQLAGLDFLMSKYGPITDAASAFLVLVSLCPTAAGRDLSANFSRSSGLLTANQMPVSPE
jgi:tetrahydromethanopterin S-methyltransferase subunit H